MKGTRSKISTLFLVLRRRDYSAALESLLSLLKKAGIYIHITDILACESSLNPFSPAPPGLTIRSVGLEEIPLITPLEKKPEIKLTQRMLEWGDECRGFFLLGEIVGYAWISRKKIRIPEVAFEKALGNNEIYLYDGFLRKEHRNRGIWTYFLRGLIDEVTTGGGILLSTADLTNSRARRIKLDNGFRKSDRVTLIRVGGKFKRRFARHFHAS